MTDNTIALLVKKEIFLDIIDLMRTGIDMTNACATKGVEPRTFHAMVAKFPEIAESMAEYQRSRIASLAESIVEGQTEAAQALNNRRKQLIDLLEAGVLVGKHTKELMAINKHLNDTLKTIYPEKIRPTSEQSLPDDSAKARANMILSKMTGAQLRHVDVKVETYRMEIGGQPGDPSDVVIDGVAIEVDQSQREDTSQDPG